LCGLKAINAFAGVLYTPPTNGNEIPLFLNTIAGPETDALFRIAFATSSSGETRRSKLKKLGRVSQGIEKLTKIFEWY
jgi:hypothetical protein